MEKEFILSSDTFCDSIVAFDNQTFRITSQKTSDTLGSDVEETIIYEVFHDGKLKSKIKLSLVSPVMPAFYNMAGWDKVPRKFFLVERVDTKNISDRNKGYATLLLNQIVSDAENFNNVYSTNYPICLEKEIKPATDALYAKFGAKNNGTGCEFSKQYMPMIIEKPKSLKEYKPKIISKQYFQGLSLQN